MISNESQTTSSRPSHRRLFTLLGIPWEATRYAWVHLLIFLIIGIVMALILDPDLPRLNVLPAGAGYGLLIYLTYMLHGVGHSLGGKSVGAPMDANLITALRHINIYTGDQSAYPQRVHIGRALGGPVINLLAGIVALGLWAILDGKGLWLFAIANLVTGVASLLPIPAIDGWVVWGALIRFRRPAIKNEHRTTSSTED